MEKKSNKLFGFLLILIIALLSLGMVIAKPMISAEKNEPDLTSLDTNDYFLDDLFLDNIVQYKHLKSLEAGKNISYSELLLKNPDAETAELFDDFISGYSNVENPDDFEDLYYTLQRKNLILDFYAESNNTRSYSIDLSDLKNSGNDKAKYFKWYIIMHYDDAGNLTISNASQDLLKTVSSKFFKGSLMECSKRGG